MSSEPPIRVRTGSIIVALDTAEDVGWTRVDGPWEWVRTGQPSDGVPRDWIKVNGKVLQDSRSPAAVRIETSDGVLFFRYQDHRTLLKTDIPLRRDANDRRQLSYGLNKVEGVQAAFNEDERGLQWEDVYLAEEPAAVV
jgi:hypothetical protein